MASIRDLLGRTASTVYGGGSTPTTLNAGQGGGMSEADALALMAAINGTASQQNNQYVQGTLLPAANNVTTNQGANLGLRQGLDQSAAGITQGYTDTNDDIVSQMGGIANRANDFDWQNQGVYDQGLAQSTQRGDALYNDLRNTNAANYGQLGASTQWAGDLSSQAAGARADAGSIAAQNSALSGLQSFGNGSGDVLSQGAQAHADALDLQRQDMAYGNLAAVGNGSLNNTSIAAGAHADQQDLANQYAGLQDYLSTSWGTKDVQQDRGAQYVAQYDALNQLKGLTNPENTAQERFLYEQQRAQEEQDQKASRGANLTNLRQRGMSGSGMELANAQLSNQENSQNRLLGDLGTQAGAVNRSMDALKSYGALGAQLQDQVDAITTGNMDRRFAATQGYNAQAAAMRNASFDESFRTGQATDAMNSDNSHLQLAGTTSAAGMATDMRNASFDEAFKRGVQGDTVAGQNSDRRLSATNMSGQLASTQRDQSFNEAFSRGTAADQTAQYNRTQSLATSQFRDNYAASQQNDAWGRQMDVTGAGYKSLDNYNTNTSNAFTSRQGTNATTSGRDIGVQAARSSANNANTQARLGQVDRYKSTLATSDANNDSYFDRLAQVGTAGQSARQTGVANAAAAYNPIAGKAATDAAVKSLDPSDYSNPKNWPIIGGFL